MSMKKKEISLLIGLGEWFVTMFSLAMEIPLLGLNRSMPVAAVSIALLIAVGTYGIYAIIAEGGA